MKGQLPSKVMLFLDALIDTRLGTLNILDPEAVQAMDPARYLMRTRDDFSFMGIDEELFNIAYKNRDTLTLRNSIMTNILPIVQNAIHQYTTLMAPMSGKPIEIDLNVYPYNPTMEEGRMMADLVEFKLGGVVKVNVIRTPYSAMTLGMLARSYHTVVIYDWVDWACAIEASFRSEAAPSVTMIAPDLLKGEKLPDEPDKYTEAAFKVAHPTAYMEFTLVDYIGLSFERTTFFSMAH